MIQVLQNYGRGLCGGLLFALPLLYTMEVWWAGIQLHPWRQAAYFLACLVVLLAYNRYGGLRCDRTFHGLVFDAVEALGLAMLVSFGLMSLLDRFEEGEGWRAMLGKTVLEAGLVSIGISVGKVQLGAGPEEEGMEGEGPEAGYSRRAQLVFGFCGALIVAAAVAPTEEIQQLSSIESWKLSALAMLSLFVCMLGLYFSDFVQSREKAPYESGFDVASGTVVSYFIALLASAGILYFFGKLDDQEFAPMMNQIVVLAFPGSLGASIGRLLLQQSSS